MPRKRCSRGVRMDGKCKRKPGSPKRLKSKSPLRSTPLKEKQFYCVSCKSRQMAHSEDITVESDKRGRPRMVGYDKHGHIMFKYISFDKADKLAEKFNQ